MKPRGSYSHPFYGHRHEERVGRMFGGRGAITPSGMRLWGRSQAAGPPGTAHDFLGSYGQFWHRSKSASNTRKLSQTAARRRYASALVRLTAAQAIGRRAKHLDIERT